MANYSFQKPKHSTKPVSEERNRVLIRMAQTKDHAAESDLIQDNIRLVIFVIAKYFADDPSQEDLVAPGIDGLLAAIHQFDLNRNIRFSTYAVRKIRSRIKYYVRGNDAIKIPDYISRRADAVQAAKENLAKSKFSPVSWEELASHVGGDAKSHQSIYNCKYVLSLESASTPGTKGSANQPLTIEDVLPSDDAPIVETSILKHQAAQMAEAIKILTPRQQQVIDLIWRQGMTLEAAGNEMGCTKQNVKSLQNDAFKSLRVALPHLSE